MQKKKEEEEEAEEEEEEEEEDDLLGTIDGDLTKLLDGAVSKGDAMHLKSRSQERI